GVPLLASALTLGLGAVACVLSRPLARFQRAISPQRWGQQVQDWVDAERTWRRLMRGIDALSVAVTPLFQRGSLPYTLGTMLVVLIALTAPTALSQAPLPDNLVLFQHPIELLVLPVAILAAIGSA